MSSKKEETRKKIFEATWKLMQQPSTEGVRMKDIAEEAGISRQAVYLHFESRSELMIATTRYLDEVFGVEERIQRWNEASSGIEFLESLVEFWADHVEAIYPVARVLMQSRATDEAAAAAWNDRMEAIRNCCLRTVEALKQEQRLRQEWTVEEATDLFFATLSIPNRVLLTIDLGWSRKQYIGRIQKLLKHTFLKVEG